MKERPLAYYSPSQAAKDLRKGVARFCGVERAPANFVEHLLGSALSDHNYMFETIVMSEHGEEFLDLVEFEGAFRDYGRPQFRLSKDLFAALVLTDADDIALGDIALPFPCFEVHLPEGQTTIQHSDTEGGPLNPVSHFAYYQRRRSRHSEAAHLTDAVNELAAHIRRGSVTQASVQHHVNELQARYVTLDESDTVTLLLVVDDPSLCVRDTALLPIDLNTTVGEWTASFINRENNTPEDVRDRENAALTRKLIVNLSLYLSVKKEARALPKPKRLKRSGKPTSRVYDLGREVRLPSQLHASAASCGNAHRNPDAWRLKSRFIVRGHWRNQACGPGRKQRKRIYVQPFWKGPQTSTEIERVYNAMTHKEAGLTDS